MCDLTPFGLFATKQVIWASFDIPNLEAPIQFENRNQIMAGTSGETEEAARAFFEKHKPRWTGRGQPLRDPPKTPKIGLDKYI